MAKKCIRAEKTIKNQPDPAVLVQADLTMQKRA